jgi:hypothetical protein
MDIEYRKIKKVRWRSMSNFNQEQQERAIQNYTELMRRVSVGAYTERSAEDFETGTYPEDGVEESIDNLEELVAKHGLEFVYSHDTKTYSLEPIEQLESEAQA